MTSEQLNNANDLDDLLSRIKHQFTQLGVHAEETYMFHAETRIVISKLRCYPEIMDLVKKEIEETVIELQKKFDDL